MKSVFLLYETQPCNGQKWAQNIVQVKKQGYKRQQKIIEQNELNDIFMREYENEKGE